MAYAYRALPCVADDVTVAGVQTAWKVSDGLWVGEAASGSTELWPPPLALRRRTDVSLQLSRSTEDLEDH